jgi:hypothetical protein
MNKDIKRRKYKRKFFELTDVVQTLFIQTEDAAPLAPIIHQLALNPPPSGPIP